MRSCYVPGCDKKNRLQTKRPMFAAPKDPTLFEKWVAALPKLRPLKAGDHVCLLHFHQEDIQSSFEHIIGGEKILLERERKRLKANAIPSKNLPSADELLLMKPSKRGRKKNVPKVTATSLVTQHNQQESYDGAESIIAPVPQPETLLSPVNTTATIIELPHSANEAAFNNLFDDVFEVLLPNTLWGVHRCPRRNLIMFVYMDVKQLCPTKMLTIESSGIANLFLATRLIHTINLVLDAHITETLSDLLEQLNNAQICAGADTNAECEIEIKNNIEDTLLCNNCLQGVETQ